MYPRTRNNDRTLCGASAAKKKARQIDQPRDLRAKQTGAGLSGTVQCKCDDEDDEDEAEMMKKMMMVMLVICILLH